MFLAQRPRWNRATTRNSYLAGVARGTRASARPDNLRRVARQDGESPIELALARVASATSAP
jgi:hypothetical protein